NENWAPQTLTDIQLNHFEPLLELEPEIIILGTGKALQFPEREIMMHIMRQGVGFEVMDTAAACRTYNILIGEDRRVAAGLLMIR
ncbi:MAG: MTH938/NDUFAF3 family protein, partial [Gammaproteobacteria bacterium]|nr:MTH938/NDUFAF3 family protein [Gammaproteobacteria bacterium]